MSQDDTKSPKHCAQKGVNIEKLSKKLVFAFSTFFLSFLSLILLVWLILHPSKPRFSLQEVGITQLNLSAGSHLLNSSIQLTLLCTNPNKKVGVYFDELQVYASYKGQQITSHTRLPPFYQGHEETNLLTASLAGTGLPVTSSFGYEVGRDQTTTGKLVLSVKADGRLRWKVGTWVSGRYRFNVNCVSILDFGATIPSGPLISKQGSRCSATI
ncbi:NDR1/HIN1-like protein 26 [Diospyros lotus]|uniref:NDR1/HIN1-like protein 26 n=1 Tax=Diospyros lotus TaxID=55363 RepID=UPI00225A981B|nr:NDR1/HIN1-like protein 26 [Diospyros lotus]